MKPLDQSTRKWLLVLLVTLVVIPLQMLNLVAAEKQKAYWCDQHFYEVRCQAAEGALTNGIAVLAVAGLALLVSLGALFDRLILPGGAEAHG